MTSAEPGVGARDGTGGGVDRRVVLVAAVADNGVIGAGGGIPWRLPSDLRHFKATTMGHTLVMGRTTYDGIGRPLPGRTTVVLTRDRRWRREGVLVAPTLEEALALAASRPGAAMVVGGARVYAAALPLATQQVLTEVHLSPAGDTFYPRWDRTRWRETSRAQHPADPGTGAPAHDVVTWERPAVEDAVGRR